jgi:UDP:flavonoid glycosyltransferase YjiC (YdhE family)
MKIVLASYGSRGDVQPMLALALALQAEGHAVLLAAPPEKSDWAARLGCPFYPLGSDLTAFIDSMNNAHSLLAAVRFVQFIRHEIKAQFDLLPRIVAGADLVIGSSLVFALATVAESLRIEYRYVAFTPQLLPSCHHPFPAFKHQRLPRWYNRMTWLFAGLLDRFNFTLLINQIRRSIGLQPTADIWHHILGRHVIVASDKALAEVPADIVPTFTQTGYLHLKQSGRSNEDLRAFLEAGPPPIYAGFGSMPPRDQARILPWVIAAVRRCGQRAVIGKFWETPGAAGNANDVFFIKKHPHLELFPHMAAVIHHGGAGTTATSAICGVPQIIVPHALDQYYWGNQIYQSNLGPAPIWRTELNADKLAVAIQQCLENEHIRKAAASTAREIRQADPLKNATRAILGA